MTDRLTPMLHVADVRKTVDWYKAAGFALVDLGEDDGEATWAELAYGDGRLMLNAGGRSSTAARRDADLYIHTSGIDALFARLRGFAHIEEEPHDTFYGMRELIVRDNNGFWITFGEPAASRGECI